MPVRIGTARGLVECLAVLPAPEVRAFAVGIVSGDGSPATADGESGQQDQNVAHRGLDHVYYPDTG